MIKVSPVAALAAAALTVAGLPGTAAWASPAASASASTRAPSGAPAVRYRPISPNAMTGRARYGSHNANGYNWGGYVLPGNGTTAAASDWYEPAVTCTSDNNLFAPWVGIDGYGDDTVEQLGVQTDCYDGTPEYAMWTELYPAYPVYPSASLYPVGVGDHMSAGVQYYNGMFALNMRDVTRGWDYLLTTTVSDAGKASAEAIIEAPGASYPDFGTLRFAYTQFNYGPIGQEPVTAIDPTNGPVYEAQTNPTDSQGNWSITYQHE